MIVYPRAQTFRLIPLVYPHSLGTFPVGLTAFPRAAIRFPDSILQDRSGLLEKLCPNSNITFVLRSEAPASDRKQSPQPHLSARPDCPFDILLARITNAAVLRKRINTTAFPIPVSRTVSGHSDLEDAIGYMKKARERIHRANADPRLLSAPTSRSRVADCDPNHDRLVGIRSPSQACFSLYRPLSGVCRPGHQEHATGRHPLRPPTCAGSFP